MCYYCGDYYCTCGSSSNVPAWAAMYLRSYHTNDYDYYSSLNRIYGGSSGREPCYHCGNYYCDCGYR